MEHLKAISVFLTTLLCIPFTGCDLLLDEESQTPSAGSDAHSDIRIDTALMRTTAEDLKNTWTYQDKAEEINGVLQELSDQVDAAYAIYARALIASDADWNDKDKYALKNETFQDYYVAAEIFDWITANGWKNSMYSDLFGKYIADKNVDYYLVTNLNRVIAHAKSSASEDTNLLDEYYESAYSDNIDTEDTNLKCAELYLKALKKFEDANDIYESFSRDYSPDDIKQVYDEIVEKIVPLFNDLDRYFDHGSQPDTNLSSDVYEILEAQALKLSPEIGKSAQKLLDEELYTEAFGDHCYDGSYTITLTGEHRAIMYTYLDHSFYDIITVSHEFGHFHSDLNVTTPTCMQIPNLDIAEAQSQCMEMLFTSRYADIFSDDSKYYELLELYNMMDNIISGFGVGQFENDVAAKLDTITPQEVVELYQQHYDACNLGNELYEITHLYEDPGYYISYGVSALPAIQIYAMMQEDLSAAITKYDKLSKISSVSGEYTFSEALESCGFASCFEPETIDSVAAELTKRISELKAN